MRDIKTNRLKFVILIEKPLIIYLGEFAAVGPTSFQFDIPDNAPITISPLVGVVEPGTVCIVFERLYTSFVEFL